MAALDRHAQHVAFIKDRQYVFIEQAGTTMGTFTCKSVKNPTGTLYRGCIGELFCNCPQCDRDICKHLHAATDTLPLTHERRLVAAKALVDSGKLEVVDLAEGVLVCRQVTVPVKHAHRQAEPCSPAASQYLMYCCHLLA
jgi:hypothetical protein